MSTLDISTLKHEDWLADKEGFYKVEGSPYLKEGVWCVDAVRDGDCEYTFKQGDDIRKEKPLYLQRAELGWKERNN